MQYLIWEITFLHISYLDIVITSQQTRKEIPRIGRHSVGRHSARTKPVNDGFMGEEPHCPEMDKPPRFC